MRRYRHAELGFALDLSDGMEVVVELLPTIALEPARDWAFQPTCVVTAEPRTGEIELEGWVDAGWGVQEERLASARLIDRQPTQVAGAPAVRTLCHHVVRSEAVTLEQWWLLDAARGWALSASCATLDYESVADHFEQLAPAFSPRRRDRARPPRPADGRVVCSCPSRRGGSCSAGLTLPRGRKRQSLTKRSGRRWPKPARLRTGPCTPPWHGRWRLSARRSPSFGSSAVERR